MLPGGTHVLFTAVGTPGPNAATIEVVSVADGSRTVLHRGGTFGRYLEGGYLTFVNQGTLFAVPMDLARLAAGGTPVAVLNEVPTPRLSASRISTSRAPGPWSTGGGALSSPP